ncbi:hypothetical protein [Streptomyces microflavus]|uniref:hypothetical protein n=1 Tax=Streptomyces microflavus TaxID=1919 RepID=UPI0036509AE3
MNADECFTSIGGNAFSSGGAEEAFSPDLAEDLHALMVRELGYAPPVSKVGVVELKSGMFRISATYTDNLQRRRTFELPLRRPGGILLTFDTVPTRLPGGAGLLRLAVRLLPPGERAEWLEEQRGYLEDLPSRRHRWAWVLSTLLAMPRYAYTVRSGSEKESA